MIAAVKTRRLVVPRGVGGRFFRAAAPQVTPTYDGSGQTVHPDVHDAGAGNLLHGHRYWMAVTPYPGGNDDFENPSILVSADGASWEVPAGLANPLVPFPGGTAHHADTDLVVDGGTMYVFYTYRNDPTYEVRVLTSTDGLVWSGPTTVVTSTVEGAASPSVVKDGATWKMWAVDYKVNPNLLRFRSSASPTSGWSAPSTCSVAGVPSGRDLWHHDIIKGPEGTFHGFFSLCNADVSGAQSNCHLARSRDGQAWKVGPIVIGRGSGGWDTENCYRGSMVFGPTGYRTWYSAADLASVWRSGFVDIPYEAAPSFPS